MKSQKSYLFKNTVFKEGDKSAKTVFSGPGDLEVGPAPEFEGSPETLNPEEMFVAAVNSCIMTTFFYFVRKSNIEVRAKITLQQPDIAEKARELGKLAEKYCLVSRSLACTVRYELEVKTIGK